MKRSRLGDGEVPHRLVIRRSAADEDELLGPVPEELQIGTDVIWRERDEVDDGVVALPVQSGPRLLGVPDVRLQDAGPGRRGSDVAGRTPDHEMDLVAPVESQRCTCAADDAGAPDEQDPHGPSVDEAVLARLGLEIRDPCTKMSGLGEGDSVG